jgi:hypothetical protein
MVSGEEQDSESIVLDFNRDAQNFKRRVPVRLRIAGVEMFGWEEPDGKYYPWDKAWIHIFVPFGLFAIISSKYSGTGQLLIYPEWGWLDFVQDGSTTVVHSTFVKKDVRVDYEELLTSWQAFANEAFATVVARQPEMATYPRWDIVKAPDPVRFCRKVHLLPPPESSWFEEDDGSVAEPD